MAWRDVLKLLELAGGKEELIEAGKMQAAISRGEGSPDVQKLIARLEYKRKYGKEADNGQTRWEFG